MLSPLSRLLHLKVQPANAGFVPHCQFLTDSSRIRLVPGQPSRSRCVVSSVKCEEVAMKKALGVLAAVALVGATAITAPAPAEARGLGPGLAFGLAAGAIAAGAAGAYGPYYGPGYGYYGPNYYYEPGYAYYGGPYYRHRYYR